MKRFKVEAFIFPVNVSNLNVSNQIDDEKLALKQIEKSFNEDEESEEQNAGEEKKDVLDAANSPLEAQEKDDKDEEASDLSGVFFDINEHIYDEIKIPEAKKAQEPEMKKASVEYTKAFLKIEEPIYDEPFVGNLTGSIGSRKESSQSNYDVPQSRWTLASSKYRRFGIVAPKLPKRSSSLQSISEDIEGLDETLHELCCHGRKDGCLPSAQRPEDISDEIFKENWMQRLDSLRKLETLLKDKEVALQSRERLLFKKEKELRILERLVKDKMKQAELYAKRFKKALSAESVMREEPSLEARPSEGLAKEQARSDAGSSISKATSKDSLDSREKRAAWANAPSSRLSSLDSRVGSRLGSMRSRSRPRQKIRYDDLDSTLSADQGDSSFLVTSKKFDPVLFKKPLAFTRSASERRPRLEQSISTLPIKNLSENGECSDGAVNALEEKALKKISENIIATQNQESKLVNYGLIDGNAINSDSQEKKDLSSQKKFSYLNLDSINKSIKLKIKSKDRPVSWSEDTDDWLKKKRQAYNMLTKSATIESTNDKENFDRSRKANKSTKIAKKKESNQKRFSIFR